MSYYDDIGYRNSGDCDCPLGQYNIHREDCSKEHPSVKEVKGTREAPKNAVEVTACYFTKVGGVEIFRVIWMEKTRGYSKLDPHELEDFRICEDKPYLDLLSF